MEKVGAHFEMANFTFGKSKRDPDRKKPTFKNGGKITQKIIK